MKDIKKLGFGLMRLPKQGNGYDVEQIKKMVDCFMGNGFSFYDTAYVYDGGRSEAVAKEVLVDRYPRDSYQFASKLPVWMCSKPEDLDTMLETSLSRTGLEYFDYYLLHSLSGDRLDMLDKFGAWEFMERKKAEGKFLNWSFSFHDTPEVLDRILTEHPGAAYVQLQINYADWDSDDVQAGKNYEVAKKHGVPVVIMEPVKGGSLAVLPPAAREIFKNADPDASLASWAIRYCASLDNVLTILSGMSTFEQMKDNVDFMSSYKPLTDAERGVIAAVVDSLKSVDTIPCTSCGYCVEACPVDVNTPGIFAALNYERIYDHTDGARRQYMFIGDKKADRCVECGACEDVCPQHIKIRELLKYANEHLAR